MLKRKRLLFVLTMMFCCAGFFQIAYAAETTDAKISRLEKKYGIIIKMDEAVFRDENCFDYDVVKSNVEGIPYEWVAALEDELRYIPTALNDYVRKNVKQPLTIRFISIPSSEGIIILNSTGQYTPGNNTISLKFGASGLVHEYGHMLDYYFFQKNGDFVSRWKSYNSNAAYGGNYNALTEQQKGAFTGDYAATNL